jgi:hypothetical protein
MIRRIIIAALVSATLLGGVACGDDGGGTVAQAQWGALGADEQATYEYIVPYGTSVRIDQGQVVDLMPQKLDVKVGESIRISNQDGRDYMIGPFYVTAGQSLAMRFTHEGELSGLCSMNPEGEFIIKVTQ